jgi:hypothetical protein
MGATSPRRCTDRAPNDQASASRCVVDVEFRISSTSSARTLPAHLSFHRRSEVRQHYFGMAGRQRALFACYVEALERERASRLEQGGSAGVLRVDLDQRVISTSSASASSTAQASMSSFATTRGAISSVNRLRTRPICVTPPVLGT